MDEGEFEYAFERVEHGHGAGGCAGGRVGGDFDFVGGGDGVAGGDVRGGLFSVRLSGSELVFCSMLRIGDLGGGFLGCGFRGAGEVKYGKIREERASLPFWLLATCTEQQLRRFENVG